MIERIVAVCQTKEDQHQWVDLIRGQIRSVRISSPASSIRPPPTPPHNSVSGRRGTPYSRLAAYFARLVKRGVITRQLLKRLLYSEFSGVNTAYVRRRRRDRRSHRVECVIYPQEAVRTYISETESESDYSGRQSEEKSESRSDSQSETSSCLAYVKHTYRSTLTISKPGPAGCADLSRMDSDTKMPFSLGHNNFLSHYQSLPVIPKSDFNESSHSSSLVLPAETLSVAEITGPSPGEESVQPIHRSYSYHFLQNKIDDSCQCSSYRSTDSGLADILASPELTTPAPDNSLPAESEGSGNYEGQCVCSSPFSTPRTSAQLTQGSVTITPTYRSAMYAHWCLKLRIPASAVTQPPGKHTIIQQLLCTLNNQQSTRKLLDVLE